MAARRDKPPPDRPDPPQPPCNRLCRPLPDGASVAPARRRGVCHLPGRAQGNAGGARRRGVPDLRVAGRALVHAAPCTSQEGR